MDRRNTAVAYCALPGDHRHCRRGRPDVDALAVWGVGMPADHREQDEEADHVGHRHVPAVPQPQPDVFASGKALASATPADEPNQIIEPPKPTA